MSLSKIDTILFYKCLLYRGKFTLTPVAKVLTLPSLVVIFGSEDAFFFFSFTPTLLLFAPLLPISTSKRRIGF